MQFHKNGRLAGLGRLRVRVVSHLKHEHIHDWYYSEETFSMFSFFFKCPITEVKVPQTTTHSRDNPFLVSLSRSLFYLTILNSFY